MTRTIRSIFVLIASTFGLTVSPTDARAQDAAPAPVPEITLVRGDLYRVQADGQVTVFLVTPAGIILADPLNYDTAAWLRKEFETRFPDRPVRYVLHTHHHFDRAEGASVFNDTAELVGHRSFSNQLSSSRTSSASYPASLDRNGNGVFERDELGGDAMSAEIAARDRNADGRITRDELYRRVREVETTFDDRRTIVLGGHSVELIHTGGSHSADMTALHFASERIVFAADHVPIGATPFSFGALGPKEAIQWVRTMSSLDVDVLFSGDGSTSTGAEIAALGEYFNDLVASAMAGYELGLSIDDLKAASSLGSKYTGPRYALRDANVAQVFQHVGTVAVDIYAVAFMGYAMPSSSLCPDFLDECTPPKNPLSSSALGLRLSGRELGAVVEMRTQQQSTYFTRYRLLETTSAHRETRLSIMAHVNLSTRNRSRLALVGGPAFSLGETKHVSFRREGVVPIAGPTAYEWRELAFGFTYGMETGLSLGDHVNLVLPARITVLKRDRDSELGSVDAYAGVGVTLKLFRTTFLK
jgi:glyoxylase-like metal-dependent hydrolase (beta-lactamase superfamily II)